MIENDLDTVKILQGFMSIEKGHKRQHSAMAALALLIMLAHEEGHDQESLTNWFAKRVSNSWNVFQRELVENAFNDPRMPKQQ